MVSALLTGPLAPSARIAQPGAECVHEAATMLWLAILCHGDPATAEADAAQARELGARVIRRMGARGADSNPRPATYKDAALPAELPRHDGAGQYHNCAVTQ